MILYLDTSALVKKYVLEPGSGKVIDLWRETEGIAVSKVGYAEVMAAFHRKKREGGLTGRLFSRTARSFKNDWKSFIRVDVSPELEKLIDRLVSKYPLRGFDAIHLASAIAVKRAMKVNLVFVAGDERLLNAAQKERLPVRNVSE
ncbi:MAG: type II toxin-antitoxin system VapC family toxin [Deltaproteobacteria bacterium]|nr:type II toxin-antitoxin system VapC family toxin [Deltaproteobacteria bacterium]